MTFDNANGDSDPMILPRYSYLLAGRIPHAEVIIYPHSAHGFLFHHHAEFAADVEAFLTAPAKLPADSGRCNPARSVPRSFMVPNGPGVTPGLLASRWRPARC